jgi:hypothetical protein
MSTAVRGKLGRVLDLERLRERQLPLAKVHGEHVSELG